MILQTGLNSQINNLVTLIGTRDIGSARSLKTLSSLRIAYRSFIEHLQKRTLEGSPGKVNIIGDAKKARVLRPLFINDSLLDDKHQNEVIASEEDELVSEKCDLIHRAQQQMENLCPQHSVLFDTVITDIFVLPSSVARGGSTSQAIGVIWANPHIDYALHDVMEMMLHELTHHTLFIDELRYGHYNYAAITDKTSWATSAILNTSRPLDKVLHSIVVAMEILLLRKHCLGDPEKPRVHPPTSVMLAQLQHSIISLESILFKEEWTTTTLFQPRAMEILYRVKQNLGVFDYSPHAETFSLQESSRQTIC